MDPGSVGREVKPEVRVMTRMKLVWCEIRLVIVLTVPRIKMMVSANPVVFVTIFVLFPQTRFVVLPVTCLVMILVAGAILAAPCL